MGIVNRLFPNRASSGVPARLPEVLTSEVLSRIEEALSEIAD